MKTSTAGGSCAGTIPVAGSGWSSMRAFLNVTQIEGGLFMIPILGLIGGTLGLLGGFLFRPRPQPRVINE